MEPRLNIPPVCWTKVNYTGGNWMGGMLDLLHRYQLLHGPVPVSDPRSGGLGPLIV